MKRRQKEALDFVVKFHLKKDLINRFSFFFFERLSIDLVIIFMSNNVVAKS